LKEIKEFPDWEKMIEYFHPQMQKHNEIILDQMNGLNVEDLLNNDRYQYWLLINRKW